VISSAPVTGSIRTMRSVWPVLGQTPAHSGGPDTAQGAGSRLNMAAKMLTGAALAAAVLVFWFNWDYLESSRLSLKATAWGHAFLLFGECLLALKLGYLLWLLLLVRRYRPVPACADAELPVCTVVVPAYNEGRQILESLRSLARSEYPSAKLEIIAVDDGSRDDTWHWMCAARRELGERIVTLQLPRNQGKRRALYEGFMRGTGAVMVSVDSDSVVEPAALRRLVGPLVRDPRVGGVAGNVRVLNVHGGPIPRMLNVCFTFTFEFMRAAQSRVNTVLCQPGALAAYRRDVLLKVLPGWLVQTFMGRPANIGEDRALTNLILRDGYHVLFQSDAVAYTQVPTRYGELCRMLIRWARSSIREDISMTGFAFRRFRRTPVSGTRVILTAQWLVTLAIPFMLAGILAGLWWRWDAFLITVLGGMLIWSTVPGIFYLLRYRSHEAVWIYAFAAFAFVGLSWISPFSLVTIHRSGWLTRQTTSGGKAGTAEFRPALLASGSGSDRGTLAA